MMNWIALEDINQLEQIKTSSTPSIIFKHSTRCPVSGMAKRNFQLEAPLLPEEVDVYYLDLIKYRDISSHIAEHWNIRHESPQVLLIQNGQCSYHASHSDIELAELVKNISETSC